MNPLVSDNSTSHLQIRSSSGRRKVFFSHSLPLTNSNERARPNRDLTGIFARMEVNVFFEATRGCWTLESAKQSDTMSRKIKTRARRNATSTAKKLYREIILVQQKSTVWMLEFAKTRRMGGRRTSINLIGKRISDKKYFSIFGVKSTKWLMILLYSECNLLLSNFEIWVSLLFQYSTLLLFALHFSREPFFVPMQNDKFAQQEKKILVSFVWIFK